MVDTPAPLPPSDPSASNQTPLSSLSQSPLTDGAKTDVKPVSVPQTPLISIAKPPETDQTLQATPDATTVVAATTPSDIPQDAQSEIARAAAELGGSATPAPSPADAPPAPGAITQPTPSAPGTSIVDILLRMGALTTAQADELNVEHLQTNKPLEDLLTEKNWIGEEALCRAKAEMYGVPFVKLTDVAISPEALTALSETVARRYGILPFSLDKNQRTLSVAMKNPLDLTAIDFAEQKTGYRLIVHYAMPSELERLVAERYAQSLSTEVTQALEETAQVAEARDQQLNLANLSAEVVRQAPITKIVETILSFAMKARASDVHIEPLLDKTRVRYRIDGILTEKLILPKSVHEATVSRIKILSGLKIDEKRIPQDGRFTFVAGGEEVDLRVSTLPTIHGEKVVMRLLRKNVDVPSLEELGLNGMALRTVQEAIKVPHGIILVTGPTGSGKTTTLYSILHTITTPKVNVMTLEDPVEYQMAGVNQVQINPQAGLTFASGLRSFLRQDPNIIMVGEIRDSETAELAIQAALTGHLVFSTLHTSSAATALPRLLDMGAEPFLLASSMTLTMGQRVVRLLNPGFREEYQPDPAVLADIKQVLGPIYEQWCTQNKKDPEKLTLYRTKTDRPQTEPEYKGRIAIFEVMRVTEEIGHMVMQRKTAGEIEGAAMKNGMLLMKQDGYLKALEGLTTIEEVLRVAQV